MTKSWSMAATCFISGILIDLDHVLDYLIIYGWRSFTIRRFFYVFYHVRFKRIYLLLHAWEWVLFLFAAAWITDWNPWLTGLFAGIALHMILDYMHNGGYIWSYSLIMRWKHDFDFVTAFPGQLKCRHHVVNK